MRAVLWGSVALVACGSNDVTYEKDVRPLLEANCVSCHVSGGIAPFALTSFAEASAVKEAIVDAVKSRAMPPYLAGPGCTEYADDLRLSDEQISLIERWVANGAQRGTPAKNSTTASLERATSLPQVDLTLGMPVAFTPTQEPDDYRCFLIDWPYATDKYVTGFNVLPGNARVVHHAIAFLITPDRVAMYQALDDAEPGPGYTCYGGPGGNTNTVAWVGSWAPGVTPTMYPKDTGLLVKPGSKIALQMHYNTAAAATARDRVDQTTLELAIADTVKKKAFIMPWAHPDWVNRHKMPIPAGVARVEHQFRLDPTAYLHTISGGALNNGAVRVHAAGMHQHLLGTGGRLSIHRPDGSSQCVLDVPRWDFHWQRSYRLATPVLMRDNDELLVSCTWNNSAEFQPIVNGKKGVPRDVNWGEGTGDEMCLGVLYVSE